MPTAALNQYKTDVFYAIGLYLRDSHNNHVPELVWFAYNYKEHQHLMRVGFLYTRPSGLEAGNYSFVAYSQKTELTAVWYNRPTGLGSIHLFQGTHNLTNLANLMFYVE